jgi:hypothetical protein
MIASIQDATGVSPHLPLPLFGDLNIDLKQYETEETTDQRKNDTAGLLASIGVDDLKRHLRQRDYTWSSCHEGRTIFSHCDYSLTTNPKYFHNF